MREEQELVQAIQNGQLDQFVHLVTANQKVLYRLCRRLLNDPGLAEDVVQDTFLKAYQRIKDFQGRSSVKTWLARIAINTAKNKLRSLKRKAEEFQDSVCIDLTFVSSEDIYRNKKFNERLAIEIDKLPERQRQAFWLRVIEDLSFEEIAEIMGCPYDTAKANYRHGLLKIKESIRKFL